MISTALAAYALPVRRATTRPGGGPTQQRFAPLDGVRAVAIAIVMAYHSGIPGVRVGGFYGQDAFFVLSGLLITTLLLREGRGRHRIDLIAFWGRRARRLLPALIVMIIAVDLYVSYLTPPGRYPGFPGDALSALFYVSNWHLIGASSNYFTASGSPSLLTHTWSLAIEEQYYLVWPLLVFALLRWRRRTRGAARGVLAVSAAGTVASAGWMARLYADGASPSRLYYGTDTHAQCLLVGSALAAALWLWSDGRDRSGLFPVATSRAARAALQAGGVLGAAALCFLWTHVASSNRFAYQGGFLCVAVCTGAVLLSVTAVPRGPLARLLGLRPVAFVGLISYGMYLWYFPIFAVVDGAHTGLRGWPLFGVRVAAVLAAATVSYYLVEVPLRTGRLLRVDARSWPGRLRPVVAGITTIVLAVGVVSVTGAGRVAAAPVRPLAVPVAAARPAGPPERVLLVGDSTAVTLGLALSDLQIAAAYHYQLDSQGTLGCGLAISALVREHGVPTPTAAMCDTRTPPERQWPAVLTRQVAQDHPAVVFVVAGRWEAFDRKATAASPWQNITEPADAAYVRAQLERVVTIAAAGGARAAIATAPCFSSGEQPDGSAWPEDDPHRVSIYNGLVAQVAADHPHQVTVVPLGSTVCPAGRVQMQIGGFPVRAPDGIHYPYYSFAAPDAAEPDTAAQTYAFASWIAPRILPYVLDRPAATSG